MTAKKDADTDEIVQRLDGRSSASRLCYGRISLRRELEAGGGTSEYTISPPGFGGRSEKRLQEGESMSFEHKVIMITGAARGIGREYCLRLAALGAAVIAVDINPCDETVDLIK